MNKFTKDEEQWKDVTGINAMEMRRQRFFHSKVVSLLNGLGVR